MWLATHQDGFQNCGKVYWKQNMYTTRTLLQRCLSLACLEIRSRNEQAINSTWNRIYSLQVFHPGFFTPYFWIFTFYLFLNWFSTHVIRLLSQAIRVYKYTKIQGPWFQRNYIIARDQKRGFYGRSFRSLPKIDRMLITRPFAYNESLQHPTS